MSKKNVESHFALAESEAIVQGMFVLKVCTRIHQLAKSIQSSGFHDGSHHRG